MNDYARNLAQSGLSLRDYMKFTGETMDSFKEHLRPDALTRIKSSLVLEAVAKAEGIEGNDEDVDAKIREAAERNGMKEEDLKKSVSEDERRSMKEQIAIEKAVDFIMENVKERKKAVLKTDAAKNYNGAEV